MNQTILTKEDLMIVAPSVFKKNKGEALTERYNHMTTEKVVDTMAKVDWIPSRVQQSTVRDHSSWRNGHQKHMIIFQPRIDGEFKKEEIPQMYYINSSDGEVAQRFQAGLFRFICSNGLVIADSSLQEVRLLHRSYSAQESLDILANYIEQALIYTKGIKRYKDIELTESEKGIFAYQALNARFGKNNQFSPMDAVTPKRKEDEGNSLWNVFNVLQENLVKGGLVKKIDAETKSGKRQVTSKQIKDINREVNFNMILWSMMNHIAQRHS